MSDELTEKVIAPDNRSKAEIGRNYGVSETLVGKIKRRENWTHV